MTDPMQTEREADRQAFEVWYVGHTFVNTPPEIERNAQGYYILAATCSAWDAWHASWMTGRNALVHELANADAEDASELRSLRDALALARSHIGELREALEGLLNALPSATTHPAIKAARAALKEKGE